MASDPATMAKRERDAQVRELTDQAHGINADLGHALVSALASVDPTDLTVARFLPIVRHAGRHAAAFGRVRAPESRSATRLLRTRSGRL